MEPWLLENDKKMFYKYLDNCSIYFEYGSGGSTYNALIRDNIKKIYSVESDYEWLSKLKDIIAEKIDIKKKNKFISFFNEMDTQPETWGYPGKNATYIQKIKYSNYILDLDEIEQKNIDLILIDGRFRVACCLKCFDVIKDNCLIAFDDFLNRPEYNIILDFFNIIDSTSDKRMVILKKNLNVNVPKQLIQKYELVKI